MLIEKGNKIVYLTSIAGKIMGGKINKAAIREVWLEKMHKCKEDIIC